MYKTMLFLLLISLLSSVNANLEPTFARCCAQGANWARQGELCSKFPSPVIGEPLENQSICLTSANICCLRFYREVQCENGKTMAKSGAECAPANGPGGEFAKDCCDSCKLGLMTGIMKMSCTFQGFDFGFPWNFPYVECCQFSTPEKVTSIGNTSTTPSIFGPHESEVTVPDSENLCHQFPGQLCGHICVPTSGSYKCQCRDGFTLSTDGKTCLQKAVTDRCQISNPCHHICQDTGISIECSCRPGYQLADDQKACEDIDECWTLSHQCHPLEQECYNQLGSYSCVNSDGSLSQPGHLNQPGGWDQSQNSLNGPSTFGAQGFPGASDNSHANQGICPPGYIFNLESRACDDVDECSVGLELCGLGVPCENTIGSYTCVQVVTGDCPPGFTFNVNVQTCLDIDECAQEKDTCSSNQFCLNTQGSFDCQNRESPTDCPAGYKYNKEAQLCEDVDECDELLHGCHPETETCRNVIGAYECDLNCGDGFRFKSFPRSCIDINECHEKLDNCDVRSQVCLNLIGSFRCESLTGNEITANDHSGFGLHSNQLDDACPDGFSMEPNTRVCQDINECLIGAHNCTLPTQSCMNILGGFICIPKNKCPTGYMENKDTSECEDIDECGEGIGQCMPGQICVNTIGTFECQVECQDGFEYNPRDPAICVDIDECLTNPCTSHGTCINTEGSYVCSSKSQCRTGFQKVNGICEDIDECEEEIHNCVPDLEECENLPGTFLCNQVQCSRGFFRNITTRECEDVNECKNEPCSWDEECINTPGHFLCRKRPLCRDGFIRDEVTKECVDIDECVELTPCGRNERCVNTRGSYNCRSLDCPPGYNRNRKSGECEDVNECETGEHSCKTPGERCINSPGTYRCKSRPPCPRGFTRDPQSSRCVDVDECAMGTSDCLENERCINQYGRYKCKPLSKHCRKGYKYSIAARRCTDVNECTEGTHTCEEGTERCVNSAGSFRCVENRPSCDFGYRYSGTSKSCEDINECEEGIDLCLPTEEICVNLPGAYRCNKKTTTTLPTTTVSTTKAPTTTTTTPKPKDSKCPNGYTYNPIFKSCLDVDECDNNACAENEVCSNAPGSFTCSCQDGYARIGNSDECKDVNECSLGLHTCAASQRCDNTIGSYICTRTASCGTGYTLNQNSGQCEDDDECLLETNDCHRLGAKWTCINTKGSFRCEKKKCPDNQILNSWGLCMNVTCTDGYKPQNKICVDIDECSDGETNCKQNEQCINTQGSFRCIPKLNCGKGYEMNTRGTQCVDIDECDRKIDKCSGGQICTNRPGGYICQCPTGYRLDRDRKCKDVNECIEYYPNVCGSNADCTNTPGSYKCDCKSGFKKLPDNQVCTDINECTETPNACDHKCTNLWGSHYCTCNSGYKLGENNRTCIDLDECEEIRGRGRLCLGICVNTPGTFRCSCPQGYRLDADKRTCKDINECDTIGACRSQDDICVNTRGSYKCQTLQCPENYIRDPTQRNRCKRTQTCAKEDFACRQTPLMYSYNFLPLASNMTLRPSGEVNLFTMSGPSWASTNVQFDLELEYAKTSSNIEKANRNHFLLKRSAYNQVVLKLIKTLLGPQEGGVHCRKFCPQNDMNCMLNATKSVIYHYVALPSITTLRRPMPLTALRIISAGPWSPSHIARFQITNGNEKECFAIKQNKRKSGWLQLVRPVTGPNNFLLRLHLDVIDPFSRRQLTSRTLAFVDVDVAPFPY